MERNDDVTAGNMYFTRNKTSYAEDNRVTLNETRVNQNYTVGKFWTDISPLQTSHWITTTNRERKSPNYSSCWNEK